MQKKKFLYCCFATYSVSNCLKNHLVGTLKTFLRYMSFCKIDVSIGRIFNLRNLKGNRYAATVSIMIQSGKKIKD